MSTDRDRPQKDPERIAFDQVFHDELTQVRARWAAVSDDYADAERGLADRDEPTTEHGLVGLGLSGGGVRSTAFNLGVLQVLVRRGVFEHVDYLSTVSGGGCLGAAVSAGMARAGAEFPYPYVWGPREDPHVTWLRNHSNYMVTKGLIDWLRIVAVLVRGILLNIVVILPLLMAVALVVSWSHGDHLREWRLAGVDYGDAFRYTRWTAIAALVYFLAYAPALTLVKWFTVARSSGAGISGSLAARDRYELSYARLVLAVLVVAALESVPVLLHGYRLLLRSPEVDRDVLAGLSGAASILASTLVFKISPRVMTLVKATLLYALGLLGLVLPLLLVLFFAEAVVYDYGPLAELAAALDIGTDDLVLSGMVGLWAFARLFIDINLTSVHALFRDRLAHACRIGRPIAPGPDGVARPVTHDLPLSELCPPGSKAPYHLINTALNLQGSSDPNIRERLSTHFIFSKKYLGGAHCGYLPTRDLEAVNPNIDLAVAMAISAGAASPNMGFYTIPSLTAVMVLLNVRFGYWLPNPAALTPWAARKGRPWLRGDQGVMARIWHRLRWHLPPRALLAEMAGRVHDDGRFVNLSDGGHLENLGGIELLRRRCKYIIIGDAEADPAHHFGGLAMLMRQARLDLGVEIMMKLDHLRLDDVRRTHQHCAIGRVVYPARTPHERPEEGWLLYIKLSITGDEDEVMGNYRAANPDFPHQSTADQFFDEGQFEAYRSLGFHAADRLFPLLHADAGRQLMPYQALHEWFMGHLANLVPGGALAPEDDIHAASPADRTPSEPARAAPVYPEMQPQGPLAFGPPIFDDPDADGNDDP